MGASAAAETGSGIGGSGERLAAGVVPAFGWLGGGGGAAEGGVERKSGLPAAAAVLLTLLNVFNLWLAARIVNVSGRLRRPWPDLTTLTLPGFTPAVLATAIAVSFLPDLVGMLSSVLAASLFMAYALMGFAVLHAITRGMASRALALTGAYAAVIVIGWPILAISMLGLAESAFNIRARFAGKHSPPPTGST